VEPIFRTNWKPAQKCLFLAILAQKCLFLAIFWFPIGTEMVPDWKQKFHTGNRVIFCSFLAVSVWKLLKTIFEQKFPTGN
jgi:hypothetical protein